MNSKGMFGTFANLALPGQPRLASLDKARQVLLGLFGLLAALLSLPTLTDHDLNHVRACSSGKEHDWDLGAVDATPGNLIWVVASSRSRDLVLDLGSRYLDGCQGKLDSCSEDLDSST
ncbi:hypothetical protein SETIT_4G237300v2 [Setaria italica]|uniref:Uncharacterized protein n=2 Tax=Setaria TaxID=4554 RepID=A0A368QXH1_SETIT|nr:hypothetical protein SETIT_4G237300v2 [Setaria italica]TKW22762.1 hypothetical protein SEVIR_4G249600v2 [Setaria viridis]TKW22763.1 hypothetical protein SEVIR_4G249600v2 [Setaria viridis]